jgi:hypothetical protein
MESTQEIETKSAFLTTLHLALLSFLIALPVFSGFDLASSTRFGIFLTLNILCGQYVWSKLLINRNPSIFESLAAGLALGTSIPAVINISIRLIGLFGFSTGYIFPIACILGWLGFDRKIPQLSASTDERDDQDFRILLATPLLAIVAWSPHAWPFCAAYIFGTICVWRVNRNLRHREQGLLRGITTAAIFVFALVVNQIHVSQFLKKPIWRLFLGTDNAYDEGVAWSISTLGTRSNALFYGHPLSGHFLTNSWAGDIASTISLPNFFLVGTAGFAIGILGISLVVYVSAFALVAKRPIAIISSLVLIAQASLPEELMIVAAPRYANSISLLYLAFALLFSVHLAKNTINHPYIFFGCLIFVVTLAKFHWGVITVGAICLVTLVGLIKNRKSDLFYYSIISMVSFMLVYLIFIRGVSNTEKIEFTFSVFYLASTVSLLVMRSTIAVRPPSEAFRGQISESILFAVSFLAVFAIWITNGRNVTTYFFSAVFIAVAMFGIPVVFDEIQSTGKKVEAVGITTIGLLLGIATSIVYVFLPYRITGVDRYQALHWFFVQNTVLVQPAILLTFFVLNSIYRKCRNHDSGTPKRSTARFAYFFLLLIGVNLGNWLVSPLKPAITRIWQDVYFDSDVAFPIEQFEVGNWLNSNTPYESIIATNFSCPVLLLSWIVPIAKRQVLIESPAWFSSTPGSEQDREVNEILADIEDASTDNSNAAFSKLADRGVDYLVIDKERSTRTSWSPSAISVYANNKYFVIKINK